MVPNVTRRELLGYAATGATGLGATASATAHDRSTRRSQSGCEHHIVLSADPGDRIEYQFTVSGSVEHSNSGGASPLSDDEVTADAQNHINGSTVRGIVGGGGDAYCFTGEIVSGSIAGDADVYLDGRPYDLSAGWPSDDSDGGSSACDQHLVIDGQTDERVYYQFTVSGSVEKSDDSGTAPLSDDEVTIDAQNHVNGSTVRGIVTEWADAYCFSGRILTGTISSNANLYLNGRPYDFFDDVNETTEVEYVDCDTVRVSTNTGVNAEIVWQVYSPAGGYSDYATLTVRAGQETFTVPSSDSTTPAVIDEVIVYLMPEHNKFGEILNPSREACHEEARRICGC